MCVIVVLTQHAPQVLTHFHLVQDIYVYNKLLPQHERQVRPRAQLAPKRDTIPTKLRPLVTPFYSEQVALHHKRGSGILKDFENPYFNIKNLPGPYVLI